MGKRRNSLIILALVLGLLGVSIYILTSKETVLGLDLEGGTELVYQGRPDAPGARRQPRGRRPRDRDHPPARRLARRLRARDLARRRGPDPGRAAERLRHRAGDRADRDHGAALALRLRAQRDPAESGHRQSGGSPLQPPDRRGRGRLQAARGLRSRSARSRGCTASGDTYYLFDANTLQPIGEPSESKEDLFANFPGERQPAEHQGARGAAGDGRGRGQARRRPRDRGRRRVRGAVAVLRPPRQAGPLGRPDHRPEAGHRPVQPADRRLQLHRRGPRGVLRGDRGDRPARRRRLLHRQREHALHRDLIGRRRAVRRLVRDRPRRRAGLEADHQLRRQPERDRRPHRRPDLRGHRAGGRRTWPRC